jgi:hypothetical protein
LIVELGQACLIFRYKNRFEAAVTITRRFNLNRSMLALQGFSVVAIAAVAAVIAVR